MDRKGDDWVDDEIAKMYAAAVYALESEMKAQSSLYTLLETLVEKNHQGVMIAGYLISLDMQWTTPREG